MFTDPSKVGPFAISQAEFARGESVALFRMLVATVMFQRRQDLQVQRILVGLSEQDAKEMSSPSALLRSAARSGCPALRSHKALHDACDLTKEDGVPTCSGEQTARCYLKKHARLLKRYGDFGKMPTSAAFVASAAGPGGLSDLRQKVLATESDPRARAVALEAAISRVWRVSTKIACMFLSCVSNPDFSPEAPWAAGVSWAHFVVIDSNVDRFLGSIGYDAGRDYESKRRFIGEVAERLDLRAMDPRISHTYNPRLVQQAMYLFMSAANRRASRTDCSQHQDVECVKCSRPLTERCPLRSK